MRFIFPMPALTFPRKESVPDCAGRPGPPTSRGSPPLRQAFQPLPAHLSGSWAKGCPAGCGAQADDSGSFTFHRSGRRAHHSRSGRIGHEFAPMPTSTKNKERMLFCSTGPWKREGDWSMKSARAARSRESRGDERFAPAVSFGSIMRKWSTGRDHEDGTGNRARTVHAGGGGLD